MSTRVPVSVIHASAAHSSQCEKPQRSTQGTGDRWLFPDRSKVPSPHIDLTALRKLVDHKKYFASHKHPQYSSANSHHSTATHGSHDTRTRFAPTVSQPKRSPLQNRLKAWQMRELPYFVALRRASAEFASLSSDQQWDLLAKTLRLRFQYIEMVDPSLVWGPPPKLNVSTELQRLLNARQLPTPPTRFPAAFFGNVPARFAPQVHPPVRAHFSTPDHVVSKIIANWPSLALRPGRDMAQLQTQQHASNMLRQGNNGRGMPVFNFQSLG